MKHRLLYVLHCYYNRAGTEEHTRTLVSELSSEYDISIVAPEPERVVLIREGRECLSLPVPQLPWPLTPFRSSQHEVALDRILRETDPHLVHVQHFYNWPLSVLDQLAGYKRPMCITFHDYYSLTPHFTMEGTDNPLLITDPHYSVKLFGRNLSDYLKERQKTIARSLNKFSRRIVPSRYLASVLSQIYPLEYQVITHGIKPFSCDRHIFNPGGMVFGYVGSLLPQKGFAHMAPVMRRITAEFPGVTLHVFGGGRLEQLLMPEGVLMHGAYNPEDLPAIMSQIDVGVIPSTFAETFSLVLSEFWEAGIPVVCSRIGALAERVKDGANGGLFIPGNEEDMYRAMRQFVVSEDWKQWQIPRPKHLEEMIGEYRAMYSELCR